MSKSNPLTYTPFQGVEFAFSPELIEPMADRVDEAEYVEEVSTAWLRPVRSVEVVTSFRRGNHTIQRTHRVITNRPMA
jgi:hypothetical protein